MSTPPPEQFFNNDWPGEDPQGEDNFDQYFDVNFDQFPNDAGYFNSDFDRYLIPDTGTVQDWENDMQPHATLPQTTAEDVAVSHGSKGKKKEVSAGTREKIRQAKTGEKNPRYGKELSAETREKIRQALAGKKHPRYGKELSEETKEKIRQAKTGKKRSEETKEKLRQANIGRKHSKETKEKIRQATTGEKNPQYGKKHSAETTEKMRQAHARRRARGVGGGTLSWEGRLILGLVKLPRRRLMVRAPLRRGITAMTWGRVCRPLSLPLRFLRRTTCLRQGDRHSLLMAQGGKRNRLPYRNRTRRICTVTIRRRGPAASLLHCLGEWETCRSLPLRIWWICIRILPAPPPGIITLYRSRPGPMASLTGVVIR